MTKLRASRIFFESTTILHIKENVGSVRYISASDLATIFLIPIVPKITKSSKYCKASSIPSKTQIMTCDGLQSYRLIYLIMKVMKARFGNKTSYYVIKLILALIKLITEI